MLEPSGYHRAPRRRRGLIVLGVLATLMLLVVGAAGGYYVYATGASGEQTPVSLEIPTGSTTADIAALLHANGVIRSELGFRLKARLEGVGEDLEAGLYELTTNMSVDEVFEELIEGPVPPPSVTWGVPEGLRIEALATRAAKALGFTRKAFLDLARGGGLSLPPYLPEGIPTTEGFLFPKTYEFVEEDVTARLVARRLLEQFEREASEMPFERADALGVTPYELVIIASMIEEEARVARDRPLIAGVIYNRLERGMALGIDATLLYDDPTPDGELSSSDLEADSPYNTRINAGLPPTPIASPGAASLRAALNPADTDFLYYVLCGEDGAHRFALTHEEHIRNVDECLG